ncbi:MAG: hypothetical protein V7731_01840 [Amphritea sp.]
MNKILFKLVVTSGSGLGDVELPLNSFRITDNLLSLSYFQAFSVYTADNLIAATDRLDGELVLKKYVGNDDDGFTETETFRANFDYLDYSKGARSGSLRLDGSKTITNSSPKAVTVNALSGVDVNSAGARVFSVVGDIDIAAGDSIIVDLETIQIEKVIINTKSKSTSAKLTEAL